MTEPAVRPRAFPAAPAAVTRRRPRVLGVDSRELSAALGLAAVLTVLLLLTADLKTEGTALYRDPGWDRHLYRAMADGRQLDFGLAPFNRRVLVPLVAGALPGSLQTGFLTVAVAASIAAGAGMYLLGRVATGSSSIAAVGVLLLFSMGWGLKFALADFWIPDATVLAFVTWAMVFALRRSLLPFAIVTAVGVLAKESVLFVLPLGYTLGARGPLDRPLLARSAVAALPAIAAWVVLHLAIPARNGDAAYMASLPEIIRRFPDLYAHYDYGALLHDIGYEQRWFARDWTTFMQYTVEPFGLPALLLAATGLRWHWRIALRLSPFIAAVSIQLLFATDTQRLITLAAPAVCLLAVLATVDVVRRLALPSPLVAPVLGAAAFALVLPQPATYTVPWEWQMALVSAAALAALAWLSHFRNRKVSFGLQRD